jgi:hypothetical protein
MPSSSCSLWGQAGLLYVIELPGHPLDVWVPPNAGGSLLDDLERDARVALARLLPEAAAAYPVKGEQGSHGTRRWRSSSHTKKLGRFPLGTGRRRAAVTTHTVLAWTSCRDA